MADTQRPSTPPAQQQQKQPLTPEQIRRIEENRLRAKALRTQKDQGASTVQAQDARNTTRLNRNDALASNSYTIGQKRPYGATRASEATVRDAAFSHNHAQYNTRNEGQQKPQQNGDAHADIQPARTYLNKYIEYDFSRMTDTKGGFLTEEDDPHNKALHTLDMKREDKPAHMTMQEWERHQLLKKLRDQRSGPFEPGISLQHDNEEEENAKEQKKCSECNSLELDWQIHDIFRVSVCPRCRDSTPEKYSLLTKTEVRTDYLLTDPELKDPDLLPRLEKPNPHKSTYATMQLYLRCQVEEYALGPKRWGSGEALDAEFERREGDKRRRKEEGFRRKLKELKRRTRVEAVRAEREAEKAGEGAGGAGAGGGKKFGDTIRRRGDRHEHEWGIPVTDPESGVSKKACTECGMEVEELEF
ncbi:MAG: hypothetical protein M1831_006821 [Alyxoria varia]|nr:MAG: hypothetical protein M1831_006821 [Alyxoria varia]